MSHTFTGNTMPDPDQLTISDVLSGAEYDGWPVALVKDAQTLLTLADHGGIYQLVWSYEGEFNNGSWKRSSNDEVDCHGTMVPTPKTPLMADASSLKAFASLYRQINAKNKAKFDEFIESRGMFAWAMDTLVWPNVSFGGRG